MQDPSGTQPLPTWIRIGAKCRWHSETTKAVHPVVVTSVDPVKRRVVVHFESDSKVWKTVPFSYIGGRGPLQPASGGVGLQQAPRPQIGAQHQDQGKRGGEKSGERKEEDDGTKTPPWYEQLWQAETREEKLASKETEVELKKLDRQHRWQQAQEKKAEEEAKQREEERKRSEELAEKNRLLILEKLRFERELEQLRVREVQFMQREDQISDKFINAPLRMAERRIREAEEKIRLEEQRRQEEEQRREEERKMMELIAARPRVSFGVKQKAEPEKPTVLPEPEVADTPEVAVAAAKARLQQRWAMDAYAAVATDAPPLPDQGYEEQHAPDETEFLSDTQAAELGDNACDVRGNWRPTDLPACLPGVAPQDYYGARIRLIYEQHNPAKLADVAGLMEKYRGSEAEMYDRICQKYGATKDPHLPEPDAKQAPSGITKQRFARKAGAPAPPQPTGDDAPAIGSKVHRAPPLGAPPPKKAPAVSSLMARFQSLVQEGEEDGEQQEQHRLEADDGDAQRGAKSRRTELSMPRLPSPPHGSRDAGGGGASSSYHRDAGGEANRHADSRRGSASRSAIGAPIGAPARGHRDGRRGDDAGRGRGDGYDGRVDGRGDGYDGASARGDASRGGGRCDGYDGGGGRGDGYDGGSARAGDGYDVVYFRGSYEGYGRGDAGYGLDSSGYGDSGYRRNDAGGCGSHEDGNAYREDGHGRGGGADRGAGYGRGGADRGDAYGRGGGTDRDDGYGRGGAERGDLYGKSNAGLANGYGRGGGGRENGYGRGGDRDNDYGRGSGGGRSDGYDRGGGGDRTDGHGRGDYHARDDKGYERGDVRGFYSRGDYETGARAGGGGRWENGYSNASGDRARSRSRGANYGGGYGGGYGRARERSSVGTIGSGGGVGGSRW